MASSVGGHELIVSPPDRKSNALRASCYVLSASCRAFCTYQYIRFIGVLQYILMSYCDNNTDGTCLFVCYAAPSGEGFLLAEVLTDVGEIATQMFYLRDAN
jgi:hypothetical protein